MKKFTILLIVGSLALAGAVMAQQPTPEESQPPGKKQAPDKKPPAEVKPAPTRAPKTEAPAVREPVVKEPVVKEPVVKEPAVTKTETKAEQPANSATPAAKKQQTPPRSKDMKSPAANAKTSPS